MAVRQRKGVRQGSYALAGALCALGFAAQCFAEKQYFNIPASEFFEACRTFQKQAPALNIVGVFSCGTHLEQAPFPCNIQGLRTHPIIGDFEPEEALRLMTEGTDVVFELKPAYSTDEPALNLVMLPRPPAVDVPRMPDLDAEEREPWQPSPPPPLAEVFVTGTHIGGVEEIISPLVVRHAGDSRRSPYATVQNVLQSLTFNALSGPSEVFDPGGNPTRGSSINLRGLGAGATLVLVDGYRQAASGLLGDFVDVSQIPWTAVDRVEVLPDGASAIYGSDAIAGVVNIILRKDVEGAETQARFGAGTGGADERLVGQLLGHHWNSGRMLVSYQFAERTALAATSRSYAADSDKRPLGGADFRSVQSNPGNLLNPFTGAPAFAIPRGQDGSALDSSNLRVGTPNLENRMPTSELLPRQRMNSLHLTLTQDLGGGREIATSAHASIRDMRQSSFGQEATLLVPASNAFFPRGLAAPFAPVSYSFLDDLGSVIGEGRTEDYGATARLTQRIRSWQASASGAYSIERTNWEGRNRVDLNALQGALADSDPSTAFNVFGDGSHTNLDTIERIRTTDRQRALSTVATGTLMASGPILDGPAGPLRLAIGLDHRAETLGRSLRTRTQFGRHVSAAFSELALPLVSRQAPWGALTSLDVSVAARAEQYSDFGSTFNPKVGLSAAVADRVRVRGTWGTSFRAPSLVDLYDHASSSSLLTRVADDRASSGQALVLVAQGNNPSLREENARTWTAGLDLLSPWSPQTSLSLTYYAIHYAHRVFRPAPPLTLAEILAAPQWSELVTRNPAAADVLNICRGGPFLGSPDQCAVSHPDAIIDARPRNLSATEVRGLDVSFEHSLITSHGEFRAEVEASYVFRFDQALSGTASEESLLDTVGNVLSHRFRATLAWNPHGEERPGLGFEATLNHAGAYADDAPDSSRTVRPWRTVDVSARYRAEPTSEWGEVDLALSATNLFNRDPPFVNQEFGYDLGNGRPYGRIVSLSIRKRW